MIKQKTKKLTFEVPTYPPKGFKRLANALPWAEQHGGKVWSIQVSAKGARTYFVGSSENVIDIMAGRSDGVREGDGTPVCHNYEHLTSVYEVLSGTASQNRDSSKTPKPLKILPYFDLEFYADKENGNQNRISMQEVDVMTCNVARIATTLLAELFPDDIWVDTTDAKCLGPPATNGAWNYLEAARVVQKKYYRAPVNREGSKQSHVIDINSERHWRALDASLPKASKRSRHLNLDVGAGVCFETLTDMAIFTGLLVQRILFGAFLGDVAGAEDFQAACRQLLVGRKEGDGRHIWELFLDDVVYKLASQLWRIALAKKLGTNRPMLVCDCGFLNTDLKHLVGMPAKDMNLEQIRSALLPHLVGRVPKESKSLSFAKRYPQLFGIDVEPKKWLPSDHLNVCRWRWVPCHTGGKVIRIAQVKDDNNWNIKPWTNNERSREVLNWLASILPDHKTISLDGFSPQIPIASGDAQAADIKRKNQSGHEIRPNHLKNGCGSLKERSAMKMICDYVLSCRNLKIWYPHARAWDFEIKWQSHYKTGKPQVKVRTRDKMCPKVDRKHTSGKAFMIIDKESGYVNICCVSRTCRNFVAVPPLMSDQLLCLWPALDTIERKTTGESTYQR